MSDPSDNPLTLFQRLKERKLVQWTLGYLAGAWVLLEVFSTLQQGMGWPQGLFPVLFALLCVGLIVTLVLAWYHGEQGRQRVSGPELLIIAGLLAVSGLGFRILVSDSGTNDEELTATRAAEGDSDAEIQPSVAVLPFVNMSGNPDNEYFSDGITEELLNALAQLPGVRVPARTSSFSFKGRNAPVREIAEVLGVAHVLEGSVRRDQSRVLITAQLSDAQTDTQLWSDTFERDLEDIFAIQREIATAIADQLQITLAGNQRETLVAEATENPEAHEAYLRGRYFWNQRTGEGIRSAITEFQRAIDLDPGYPEAHSGLADSYAVLDIYASVPDVRIVMEQAREAAQRAVALAPDLGMAHTSLAWAFTRLGEWENSESEFERAIGLSPGYATAHQWYGDLLRFTGRADEAVLVARRASEADPVSQIVNLDFGWALHIAGRAGEAVEQMRRTIELDPSWPRGWRDLSWILVEAGAYDEALDALLNSGADSARARERVEAVARYVETGEAQSLSFSPSLPWVAATGQRERALERVDRYVQERNYFQFAYSHRRGITGTSDLLGDDPRYQALLEEAGITW